MSLPDKIRHVQYKGDYLPLIDRFMFTTIENTKSVIVNMLRTQNTIGSDSESLSDATVICCRNVLNLIDGFRENVPGFETHI